MTIEEMFEILNRAEIKVTEAAELFGVAHSTVFDWRNGETRPRNKFLFDHAVAVTRKIEKAWENGYFPMKDVKPGERKGVIRAALAAV